MTLTFSPVDPASALPDKVYSFGTLEYEDVALREDISITQEIIGVYLLPNATPDFEGVFFLFED